MSRLFALLVLVPSISFAAATKVGIDTAKSTINWKGTKAFVSDSHTGTVAIKDGFIMMDGEKVTGGEFTLDMKSIKNADLTDEKMKGKLVGHLESPDFFDVANNPTSKFVLKKATAKNANEYTFEGEATIRGTPQPMTINAQVRKDGKVYIASGKADFDRTKFGVKYNSKDFFPNLVKSGKDKVINNQIELDFNIVTLPK